MIGRKKAAPEMSAPPECQFKPGDVVIRETPWRGHETTALYRHVKAYTAEDGDTLHAIVALDGQDDFFGKPGEQFVSAEEIAPVDGRRYFAMGGSVYELTDGALIRCARADTAEAAKMFADMLQAAHETRAVA